MTCVPLESRSARIVHDSPPLSPLGVELCMQESPPSLAATSQDEREPLGWEIPDCAMSLRDKLPVSRVGELEFRGVATV